MKPLDDEQRNKIWKEIKQALIDSANPREGELTMDQLVEMTGQTVDQLHRKMKRLLKEEVLGVRKISVDGARYNVYFPLQDEISGDEILEILTE